MGLLGIPWTEFKDTLLAQGLSFRHEYAPKIIWDFLYDRGVTDIQEEMTSLSKLDRAQLASTCQIGLGSIAEHQKSNDGTQKWLFQLNDPKASQVETVFIPKLSTTASSTDESASDEGTICVSSQVGCALACKFCHTGTQKFKRNLSSGEILAQVIQVMRSVGDLPRNPSLPRKVTNLVFMVRTSSISKDISHFKVKTGSRRAFVEL